MLDALLVVAIGVGFIAGVLGLLLALFAIGRYLVIVGLAAMCVVLPVVIGASVLHGQPPQWALYFGGGAIGLMFLGLLGDDDVEDF